MRSFEGKIKNRKEIEPESVSAQRTNTQAFCFLCGAQVGLITFAQAAIFAKTNRQEILALVEKGALHRLHNSQGEIMICFDSLQNAERHIHETLTFRLDDLEDVHITR